MGAAPKRTKKEPVGQRVPAYCPTGSNLPVTAVVTVPPTLGGWTPACTPAGLGTVSQTIAGVYRARQARHDLVLRGVVRAIDAKARRTGQEALLRATYVRLSLVRTGEGVEPWRFDYRSLGTH